MAVNDLPASDEVMGMFLAGHAVTVALINQGVLDREKTIDQMLELMATMTPRQREGYYARYLELSIQILEGTQFQKPGGS